MSSQAVFLALSVVFISALYYFMFMANKKKSADSELTHPDPQAAADGNQARQANANRRDAANRLRNRRQSAAADSEGESEEEKFDQWAQDNADLDENDRRMTRREQQRHERMQMRRQQREAMAQQREEENKQKSDKSARQEEAERRREERDRQIEEQERREEEEKARKEQEEFNKWKQLMQVEETGIEKEATLDDAQLSQRFVQFIQRRKVVMLEDLAAEFKMLTKEVVAKIEQVEKEGKLTGVFDDRGKYIYVTKDEFDAVADYILKAGRVNRSELQKEANRVIRLAPTSADSELLKQEQRDVLSKVEQAIGSNQK